MSEAEDKLPNAAGGCLGMVLGYIATAVISGAASPLLCLTFYGHDLRDAASRWGIFPLVHFGEWLLIVLVSYPLALLFTTSTTDPRLRLIRSSAIAATIATVATVAFGALNPDREFFIR